MVNLVDFIPKGKINAVNGRHLSEIIGVSNRNLREMIEIARNDGAVIASSSTGEHKGYYIPENETEKEDFFRQYESYIKKMRKTLYNMRGY